MPDYHDPEQETVSPVVVDIEKGTVSGWLTMSLSDGSFFMLPASKVHEQGWEQPGTPVDTRAAADLQRRSWYQRIERKAMDSLARAEQCRARLQQKLIAKRMPADLVAAVLDDLEQRNLLSDVRYAEQWSRTRMLRRGEGPRAVLYGLLKRGVPSRAAELGIAETIQENPGICQQALERAIPRLRRTKAGRESTESLARALRSEGFAAEAVAEMLKNV